MLALVAYILSAICFAVAYFSGTVFDHSAVAAGLFLLVIGILLSSELFAAWQARLRA